MKAIQISAERQMAVVNIEKPQLMPDEVLLELKYVGFCGSDLSTYLGKNPMVKMPVIPGHEVGATIVEVGENVPEGLKPGMTVTVNPYTNCGKCASCRNNRVNACQHNETLGVQRNGAMREYISLPWEKIIPAGLLDTRTCALIEPMSVGFHAVSRAQVTDIDVVMVIGCGIIITQTNLNTTTFTVYLPACHLRNEIPLFGSVVQTNSTALNRSHAMMNDFNS